MQSPYKPTRVGVMVSKRSVNWSAGKVRFDQVVNRIFRIHGVIVRQLVL